MGGNAGYWVGLAIEIHYSIKLLLINLSTSVYSDCYVDDLHETLLLNHRFDGLVRVQRHPCGLDNHVGNV